MQKVLVYGYPNSLGGKEFTTDPDLYFIHECGTPIHIETDYYQCPICGGHIDASE